MTQLFISLSDEQAQHIAGGRWTIVGISSMGDAYKEPNGPMWSVDYTAIKENNGGKQKEFSATFTGKKSDVDAFIEAYG